MTDTTAGRTISALAAVAVVFAVAGSPAWAGEAENARMLQLKWQEIHRVRSSGAAKKQMSKELVTKKGPKAPVACDCSNCSATHCNAPFYEEFAVLGKNGTEAD